jgi:restriction endonuclease Mrr
VLIDGSRLVELMMEHHVGATVESGLEVLRLDPSYFQD